MFAAKQNIIPHFETICSVDHGADVNWKVWACKSIVEKAMADTAFQVSELEAASFDDAKKFIASIRDDNQPVYGPDGYAINM